MNREVRWRAMLLTASLLASIGLAQAGELVDEVDRFTGIRSFSWNSVPEGDGEFSFVTYANVSETNRKQLFDGYLITYGESSRFANCNSTYWILDGQRAPEITTKYKPTSTANTSVERFILTDPAKMLPRLAAAKKIEYRVCDSEGQIAAKDLEGMRQVLARAAAASQ